MAARRQPFKLLNNAVPPFDITVTNVAFVIVDVQHLTVDESGGFARIAREKGIISELKYYYDSVSKMIPNIRSILSRCRELGIQVVFSRLVSSSKKGHDLSLQNQVKGITVPHNSEDSRFIRNLCPEKGELVINKKCDNPFNCTDFEDIIRDKGIRYLIICGVISPGYLNTTVLDAADRGFGVTVASDACAGGVRGGTRYLTGGLVRVRSTKAILSLLSTLNGDHK